ncbi:hypothetical protein AGDE_16421 [Angomonas deanei]|uniref:Uncharacterized protein n=1 Tax=Angomonas deanei TaxID=59799 RepID=A0A7G2CAV8_9TRYP|nr:hypothetical protein AGDE_16421 [Angomonas deanei]CAD2216898.1 hypothetical protein, conserved [Angomonas deanei]|eukprot:EPY17101.1 hypothetical protein AGDE_16421 [Angomonas deanei]
MKRLFVRRDELAFASILMIKHFRMEDLNTILLGLVEANVEEEKACVVLLSRFATAVEQKDLDEVEVLITMLSHLIFRDENQKSEFLQLLGTHGEGLAVIIVDILSDRTSVYSLQGHTSPAVLSPSPSTLFEETNHPSTRDNSVNHTNFAVNDSFGSTVHASRVMLWVEQNKEAWNTMVPVIHKMNEKILEKFNERKKEKLNEKREREKKESKRERNREKVEEEALQAFTMIKQEVGQQIQQVTL